ncbi:MAG: 5-(carboxyamino)imidazole ribonucleotide synthase, partial [Leptospiraceae bacterium]|nr:5-(carboxyamino)imidazole ribonucleotide synthase [Leptospiraceae bacterium]
PCIMKNIIGFDFQGKEDKFISRLKSYDYKLHLYQKSEPKKGRKMGHWNYLGSKPFQEAFPY